MRKISIDDTGSGTLTDWFGPIRGRSEIHVQGNPGGMTSIEVYVRHIDLLSNATYSAPENAHELVLTIDPTSYVPQELNFLNGPYEIAVKPTDNDGSTDYEVLII